MAGIAVRSPTSISHEADSGIANEPFGSLRVTRSPVQSRPDDQAHSVTSPSSCTTTSMTSSDPSHERTV